MSNHSSDFARGYITCGYLLGHRDCLLPAALPTSTKLTELQQRLTAPEQNERARALARELSQLYAALQHGRLK